MPNRDQIRALEEISLYGWPVADSEQHDGWWLRANGGYTRRANSVQPLARGNQTLDAKIAYCRDWYQQRSAPLIFRLTAASEPPTLDDVLAQRAYKRSDDVLVQTANLHAPINADQTGFTYETTLPPAWLSDWSRWTQAAPSTLSAAAAMLGDIEAACFGRVGTGALGLAVLYGGYIGLFNIVTAPDQRRQGYGARLVAGLLRWGQSQGAMGAYLQVHSHNDPAQALYQRFGFATHHTYWYRAES